MDKTGRKVDNYFIFFDQIKVLTDIFITRFDGDTLAEVENVQSMEWSSPEGVSNG